MDDEPEEAGLIHFPKLKEALAAINCQLLPRYEKANAAAISHQTVHSRLAKIAIFAGVLAACLAIVQLALKKVGGGNGASHSWFSVASLEYLSVGAGLLAVGVGLFAKYNRQ